MGPLGGAVVGDVWAADGNGLYWLALMALAALVAVLAAGTRRPRSAVLGRPTEPPPPLPERPKPARPTGGFPVIRAGAAMNPRPPAPAVQFVHGPVVPVRAVRPSEDGPGRYRVVGVDRATADDVTMDVEALSLANAKVKAELKGVVVTAVEKYDRYEPVREFEEGAA